MVITYYGGECFRIGVGETTLGFNPFEVKKGGSEKAPRFGSDVIFVSLSHPLFNATSQLTQKGKESFVISGPGEYEIRDVFVKGYPSKSFLGESGERVEEARINTIYAVRFEGMYLVFLGALGEEKLDSAVLEDLGDIDILFVPIGNMGTLAPHEAYKLAVNLSPKLIIPMHYEGVPAEKGALETFLKEGGREKVEKKEKLTIKPKDLAGMENEIVTLASSK